MWTLSKKVCTWGVKTNELQNFTTLCTDCRNSSVQIISFIYTNAWAKIQRSGESINKKFRAFHQKSLIHKTTRNCYARTYWFEIIFISIWLPLDTPGSLSLRNFWTALLCKFIPETARLRCLDEKIRSSVLRDGYFGPDRISSMGNHPLARLNMKGWSGLTYSHSNSISIWLTIGAE